MGGKPAVTRNLRLVRDDTVRAASGPSALPSEAGAAAVPARVTSRSRMLTENVGLKRNNTPNPGGVHVETEALRRCWINI